ASFVSASTSSSLNQKLSRLQDLHDCTEKLPLLPLNQQILSHEQQGEYVDKLLNGSLGLLDVLTISKDALLQVKNFNLSCAEREVLQKALLMSEREQHINEMANAEASLLSLVTSKTDLMQIEKVQNELKLLDSCLQDLEEGLEGLLRGLIKIRVNILNILNN
ncbi:hypothetical protein Godav_025339, partial [Gossypium davidsonii]|nr:hypothetical protein [Gossypium davidsonii]